MKKNKIIRITEQQLKSLIKNTILKEEEQGKYTQAGSNFKEQYDEYIERIKSMSQGMDKIFTATDDIEYTPEMKQNKIDDMKDLRDLMDRMIDNLEKNK